MKSKVAVVKKCIARGWKNWEIPGYSSFKEELCVVNGIIIRANIIVIPSSMCKEMLDYVHARHLAVDQQKTLAEDVMYWQNMNRDIDVKTQGCQACLKFILPNQGPVLHTPKALPTSTYRMGEIMYLSPPIRVLPFLAREGDI